MQVTHVLKRGDHYRAPAFHPISWAVPFTIPRCLTACQRAVQKGESL